MLKAEVSRRRKAFTLLDDLVWFAVGAAWVFSDTDYPSLTDIRGPLGKSPVELILGIGLMTTYAISLVHDWYFGGVLKRYRANSRTLAILCPSLRQAGESRRRSPRRQRAGAGGWFKAPYQHSRE